MLHVCTCILLTIYNIAIWHCSSDTVIWHCCLTQLFHIGVWHVAILHCYLTLPFDITGLPLSFDVAIWHCHLMLLFDALPFDIVIWCRNMTLLFDASIWRTAIIHCQCSCNTENTRQTILTDYLLLLLTHTHWPVHFTVCLPCSLDEQKSLCTYSLNICNER